MILKRDEELEQVATLVDSIHTNVKNRFGDDAEMVDGVLHVLAATLLTGRGQKVIDDLAAMAEGEEDEEDEK